MINSISFENYKAFDKGRIEIKPITVLLGANSVGKSAILQLLLLLQQTNKANNRSYRSALKLYGGSINLGDTKNIFKNYATDKELKISFEFIDHELLSYIKNEILNEFKAPFYEIGRYMASYRKNESLLQDFYEKKSKQDFLEFLENLVLEFNDLEENIDDSRLLRNLFRHSFGREYFGIKPIKENNINEITSSVDFLGIIANEIQSDNFKIDYTIVHSKDRLLITKIDLLNDQKNLISFKVHPQNNKKNKYSISSDFYEFKEQPDEFFEAFYQNFSESNTLFEAITTPPRRLIREKSFFSSILTRLFELYQNEISSSFEEEAINYVSPLRAHPKRYYMLDKAKMNISLDTLDGDALAEVLKENKVLREKVNMWLKTFGLNVNVEAFKEVIHKLKIEQNNLSLDITDVGFGISQVLPVIIQGFLSHDNSLTIIEQPEIHLHPKMQADMADLFIDIINEGDKKNLLIETHSEYFLKRLRRRIAEKKIDYNDVVIYLIESEENTSKIENLNLQPGGSFKYPKDYYGGELLKDATEFIKLSTTI